MLKKRVGRVDSYCTAERRLGTCEVALLPQGTTEKHVCWSITGLQLDRPAEEGLGLYERTALTMLIQQQIPKSAACIDVLRVTCNGYAKCCFGPVDVLPIVFEQDAQVYMSAGIRRFECDGSTERRFCSIDVPSTVDQLAQVAVCISERRVALNGCPVRCLGSVDVRLTLDVSWID